ncbi:putative CAAX amino terminal protease family protein [Zostera marina]|uniref:Putative CAAX amino terminal protease family protein n=1 Tax=Zostera marina TaxID=29655 RepID=A0A0K9PIW8_ZOSMR|nr:putative CAAX amino terminal protease family protein [Zostera marina]
MILSTLYQILEEGEMLLLSVPNYPLRSRLINSGLYRSSNYSRRLGSFRSLDSVHGSQFDTIFCSPTSLTPPALTRTFSRINVKKNRGLSLPFLCKKSDENFDSPLPAPNVSGELLAVLQRWDVPWPWQAFVLTNIACALSFILVGLVESFVSTYIGFQGSDLSLDTKSELLFVNQFIVSATILGVIFGITKTFRPFPDDVFCYSFKEPLNLRNGWLLWAGIGFFGALVTIALAGSALTFFNGESPQRDETDSLMRLLPLIGSSNISTACLLGITGILAPVLEETVFRGFLMVTLTKWLPTPISVLLSAALFSLAHLSPGEFPQLFILGCALGFSYAQTHNLMTPITIHAFWNSGVILLLTFLQLQGYNINELLGR